MTGATGIPPVRFCLTNLLHDHSWWFARQINETPGCELVGVAEERVDLRERMREQCPRSTEFFGDVGTMLDRLAPDALVMLAPNNEHRHLAAEASSRGIHCMTDQPMASTYADALAMKEAADRAGTLLMVNCYALWEPRNYEFFRLAESGSVGDIREVSVTRGMKGPRQGYGILTPQYIEWMYDPERHGPGVLYDQCGYGVLYSLMLLGRPESVYARRVLNVSHGTRRIDGVEGWIDDSCYLVLEYRDATGIVSGSWAWPHPRGEIQCSGSLGVLTTRFGEHCARLTRPGALGPNGGVQTDVIPPPDVQPTRKHGVAHFAHAIRHGLPIDPPQSAATSAGVMEILDAAKSSIRDERTVVLADRPEHLDGPFARPIMGSV